MATNSFGTDEQSYMTPWLDPANPGAFPSDFPMPSGAQLGTTTNVPGGSPTFQESMPGVAIPNAGASPASNPSGASPWLDSGPGAGAPASYQKDMGPSAGSGGLDTPETQVPGSTTPNPADVSGQNSYNFNTGGGDKPGVAAYAPMITAINTAKDANGRGVAMDLLAQQLQKDLTADGHKVSWNNTGQMIVDGRAYELGGTSPSSADQTLGSEISALRSLPKGSAGGGNTPDGTGDGTGDGSGGFTPTMDPPPWLKDLVPTYTPTLLDTSVSGLPDFATLYQSASGNNPNEQALDTLVGQILAHPESLSEQDIATLKAKSAEEAAVAAQSGDQELLHFGANTGLNDSPWLASQRASNAQNRTNTTIQSNRNLDIAAADRRATDQRSAAALGTAAAQAKSGRAQAATAVALQGVLAKTNEQTNRAQLNESFKQAATSLGLSTASLVNQYIMGNAGVQIDVEKLNTQSLQFRQQLALAIADLKQKSDQFDAQLQLELQQFQHTKDNDAWTQAQAAYAA